MRSAARRSIDWSRHGEYLAALFRGKFGSNQRAATFRRFDHDDTQREATENAVAAGENRSVGGGLRGEFRKKSPTPPHPSPAEHNGHGSSGGPTACSHVH